MTSSDRPAQQYRVVVEGELDDRCGIWFDGMRMEREHGTTVATGTLVDQAHLLGVIEQFHELGLELLSVEQVHQPAKESTERRPRRREVSQRGAAAATFGIPSDGRSA